MSIPMNAMVTRAERLLRSPDSNILPRLVAQLSLWRAAWSEARALEREAHARYSFFGDW